MLINNEIMYEPGYKIEINTASNPFFYFFDYDERSFDINMEFQHFHQFYELCIFLDESAGHIIEGNWYDLACGDIVVIRPNLLHKTQYPQGNPNKRLIINFSFSQKVEGLSESYQKIMKIFQSEVPVFRFERKNRKLIFDKLNEIFYLSKQTNELSSLLIHQKFLEFLGMIYLLRKQNIYSNHTEQSGSVTKMYDITSYIHTHYQDDLSLNTLSKLFYINNYYLSHQFKLVTGFTLTNYIQMTRIRNAQTLLLSTSLSITDIAFQCGFSSFSQFNRSFNKFTGKSPSQFRKNQAAGA